MSKTFQALSATEVKSLLKKPGRFCDGEGLWLFVASAKSASWIFRYSKHKRQRDMGLGSARDVPLADARQLAAKARSVLALGGDPMQAKKDDAAKALLIASRRVTFKDAADVYIAAHEASWANPKHRQQWRNTLATYVHPSIGSLPVQDVDTAAVLKVLEPIWPTKRETARRVRSRVEMILDASKTRGERDGENPARWHGHLKNLLAGKSRKNKKSNHPSLPWEELPAFMAKLRMQAGIAPLALQFTILTVARTNEVISGQRTELNISRSVWTVPGLRMKSGRDHRVPLPAAAIDVLTKVQTKDGAIFRANQVSAPLSNAAMSAVLNRMGFSHVTVHGMRTTFRTWVQDTMPEYEQAAEAALAHKLGDETEQAYARSDLFERRRTLMEAWAAFCLSHNVVELPARAVS